MIFEVTEQLNSIIKSKYSSLLAKKAVQPPVFLSGDYKTTLATVLKNVSPNGKVLTVAFYKTFLAFNKSTEQAIERAGAAPVNFIVESVSDKIEEMSDIFACAEDVRAVLFFDRELAEKANYFATVRNIPSVYIPTSINVEGGICPQVFIRTGDKIDEVKTLCAKYVLVDDKIIDKSDVAQAYASLVSRFIAVFDNRIKTTCLNKKIDSIAFSLFKDAVLNAYKINSVSREAQAEYLFAQGLKAETANYISGGELSDKSAIGALKVLYGKDFNRIKALSFMIGMYGTLTRFNPPKSFLSPDYNKIAETVSKFFGVNEFDVLDCLNKQVKMINLKSERVLKGLNSLKNAIAAVENTMQVIQKTFVALGGEKFAVTDERFVVALLSSGDYPFLNGMSIAREWGFLTLEE